ncbi:PREDICTED: mucin-5AC-like [Trachymyrmex cornetzi]|uniref:mucin-5AC-like n=1 Tax=Trachymyrmex cornetzi TaxID=471704 RepID=UPI00084F2E80|nr:PREDICTED: mucin-5AC-like [Trachymyrmex cornetzi]
MADPQVHCFEYPPPPKVRCLKCAKCFGDEGVGKVRSEYSDPSYLSKHLKKFHPGDTIIYKCSKCNYIPKGKYHTYRQVKAHFIKCHVSPAEDTACPSTRGSLGECNSGAQSSFSGVARATTRLAETVGGPDRRQAATSGSRQLTLPSTATPSPTTSRANQRTSTTPMNNSPSYAAVTAGPSTRSTTSSTTARSRTVAKSAAPITTAARRSGEAAATRKSPTTATVSRPRVTSVEVVRLPVKSIPKAGVQNAAKPVRAPSHPPQRTSLEAGGPRPPVAKEKCGEGAVKKLPANKEPPISTRTRRATSVPAEKSEDTARRERVSPHPPRHIESNISLLSSDEEGTQFQPNGVGRLKLKRTKATGPPPKTTSNERVVTRSRRSTSAPVEKSAVDARLLAPDRPSSRATGNLTSPIAGGPINIMDQWRTPPAMLPSLPPTTRGSPAGSPGEILISLSPATSLPTTLTTCTVTTTTCGSPITSTGFTGGVGRQTTPPTCLPQRNILPTIGEERTSPCVAVTTPPIGDFNTSPFIQPGPSTPEPERGLEERRQEGAASRTPITEGDNQWGGQWTVSVGRRAKRRLQENNRSPSNPECPPTAGPSRSPRIAPLCALIAASTSHHDQSLNVERTYDDICQRKTPPRNTLPIEAERRRRET